MLLPEPTARLWELIKDDQNLGGFKLVGGTALTFTLLKIRRLLNR
ncbi:MAG: hypothetical protein PHV34_12105 [Verrucomicrobiae bacterium]|nr:hypothetical protein [Verrucomicrobiae bacterium]